MKTGCHSRWFRCHGQSRKNIVRRYPPPFALCPPVGLSPDDSTHWFLLLAPGLPLLRPHVVTSTPTLHRPHSRSGHSGPPRSCLFCFCRVHRGVRLPCVSQLRARLSPACVSPPVVVLARRPRGSHRSSPQLPPAEPPLAIRWRCSCSPRFLRPVAASASASARASVSFLDFPP